MKKLLITTITFLISGMFLSLQAQAENQDFMRSIGKIYVVVAVIIAIFLGIILFLVYLERKLTKLENQIKEND